MFLDVGNGHKLFYEIVGSPEGKPIVVLHGGPGAPTSAYRDSLLSIFDLRKWRILLWDQRGCGRSKASKDPRAHNTTWDLVADMERLRSEVMGVDRWTLFGGSWGTTLALAYVSKHLDHVAGLLLRGVSLLAPWENEWLYGPAGVARLFPEEYAAFSSGGPPDTRSGERVGELVDPHSSQSMLRRYSRLLASKNRATRRAAANRWTDWESSISSLRGAKKSGNTRQTTRSKAATATLETHYFSHNAWVTAASLLAAARRIPATVPVLIVQGRYDMVCPPSAAITLAKAVPHARIRLTVAGHTWSDPENKEGLKAALALLSTL